mgnify:CR=1 FL=1
MKKLFLLLFLFLQLFLQAQNVKRYLYKGFVDSRPVTLYLKSEDNQCTAELNYSGMYKYDKVSNWLQLEITKNDKNQFILVEYSFTGALILSKQKDVFSGIWISPDSKKQLKVEFKLQNLTAAEAKSYDDKYDQMNYENNDC